MVTAAELVQGVGDPPSWSELLYRRLDVEVFYFNNTNAPTENCDRDGPALRDGPHHRVASTVIEWAMEASDPAGVWRVLVVYDHGPDAVGRGSWMPLELSDDDQDGVWRGSIKVAEGAQLT